MQPLTGILNFVQLTPDVGTSGQPLAHQFQQIADAGYKTVIDLAMAKSPILDKWAPRMDAVWRDFLELSASEVLPDV